LIPHGRNLDGFLSYRLLYHVQKKFPKRGSSKEFCFSKMRRKTILLSLVYFPISYLTLFLSSGLSMMKIKNDALYCEKNFWQLQGGDASFRFAPFSSA
jgi:hypothetical protein